MTIWPCRPARALTRRQWRASELRWLRGKRWKPTWSLSWQLHGPRLPHMSTGKDLRRMLHVQRSSWRGFRYHHRGCSMHSLGSVLWKPCIRGPQGWI